MPQGSWQEDAVSAFNFIGCVFNILLVADSSGVFLSLTGHFHLILTLLSVCKKETVRICRRDRVGSKKESVLNAGEN